jgi:DNA polymerase III epsilon subunit-like protein
MDDAKIFKEVDLQQVILRINEQREFIKAVREGKSVNPPEKPIHDTWISVLGITDDMLAISPQEMQSYVRYLRAMKLIFEGKKVARDVSPDIWQEIEDRLLVTDF